MYVLCYGVPIKRNVRGPRMGPRVLTICRAESPSCRDHRKRGAAMNGADVVHVWVDVWVWGAKGRIHSYAWRIPVGWDSDDRDIRKCRAACQYRRPGLKNTENKRNQHLKNTIFKHKAFSFSQLKKMSSYVCIWNWITITFGISMNRQMLAIHYCFLFLVLLHLRM